MARRGQPRQVKTETGTSRPHITTQQQRAARTPRRSRDPLKFPGSSSAPETRPDNAVRGKSPTERELQRREPQEDAAAAPVLLPEEDVNHRTGAFDQGEATEAEDLTDRQVEDKLRLFGNPDHDVARALLAEGMGDLREADALPSRSAQRRARRRRAAAASPGAPAQSQSRRGSGEGQAAQRHQTVLEGHAVAELHTIPQDEPCLPHREDKTCNPGHALLQMLLAGPAAPVAGTPTIVQQVPAAPHPPLCMGHGAIPPGLPATPGLPPRGAPSPALDYSHTDAILEQRLAEQETSHQQHLAKQEQQHRRRVAAENAAWQEHMAQVAADHKEQAAASAQRKEALRRQVAASALREEDLSRQLAVRTDDVSTLQAQLSAIQQQAAEAAARAPAPSPEVEELQAELFQSTEDRWQLQRKLERLQVLIEEHEMTKGRITGQLEAAQRKADRSVKKAAELKLRNDELKAKAAQLGQSREAAEVANTNTISRMAKEIEEAQGRITELDQQLQTVIARAEAVELQNLALEADLVAAHARLENAELEVQVVTVRLERGQDKADDALRSALEDAYSRIDLIAHVADTNEQRVHMLEAQLDSADELQGRLNGFDMERESSRAETAELREQILELQSKLAAVEEEAEWRDIREMLLLEKRDALLEEQKQQSKVALREKEAELAERIVQKSKVVQALGLAEEELQEEREQLQSLQAWLAQWGWHGMAPGMPHQHSYAHMGPMCGVHSAYAAPPCAPASGQW